MGAKDTMKTFFASVNEQTVPTRGYGPKIVSTPMGPFSFNSALGVWVNANNGMQMPNIAFQDMYAMMDYGVADGAKNIVTSSAPSGFTPNPVDWGNYDQFSMPTLTTIGQQITGINDTITLKLNISGSGIWNAFYLVNTENDYAGTQIEIGTGTPYVTGDTATFTVSNNDWLFFRFFLDGTNTCLLSTVAVINTSDNNAVLDTFNARLKPRSGLCP